MALLIRRALLIANPASRSGRKRAARAARALAARGVTCDVVLTERAGHAAELARERAAGYDAVFTVGGDGTAMEVAGALANSGQPIGVIPAGTGNLLARAVGIPLNVRKAVDTLLDGDVATVDLGRLPSGHRFAIAAGSGIDAQMVAGTPRWLKRRLGVLAYTIIATKAALRAVIRRDFFRVTLVVDGEQCEERPAASVLIANFGAILNERITFGPGIRSDDGVLDACIFSPRSLGDAFRIMWRVMRKDFRSDPCLYYRSGRVIRVATEPPQLFQADGELLGSTPVEITVEPLAARFLVPRGP